MSDYLLVKKCLEGAFPWGAEQVAAKEKKWRDEAEYLDIEYDESGNEWLLVSQVFIPRVFGESDPSEKMLSESSRFIECLLNLSRDSIDDLVLSRIVDNLLGYPDRWVAFEPFAGPRLRALIERQSPYYRT
ncbi:hypothetical protein ABT304_02630 [Nocardioides sp. NPDC000445]|uniref:hypothetical protein n=1 Tax=Nocardioides sp. NPDC000445 TaxID=3154257 RepID=UPI003325553E